MLTRLTSILAVFSAWQQSTYAQSLPNDLMSDLVMHLPFDGHYRDVSGNNNNAMGFNTTFFPGITNQAAYCDGNAYVKGAADNLPTAERTIAFWLYPFSVNQPGLFAYGGSANASASTSWLQAINSAGIIGIDSNFYIAFSYSFNSIKYHYTNQTDNLTPILNWHHWVTTTNANESCIYIDGKKKVCDQSLIFNSTSVAGKDFSVCVLVSPAGLAPYATDSLKYFNGMIDELLVYRKALTDAQILKLYELNVATTTTQSSTTQAISKLTSALSTTNAAPTTSNEPTNANTINLSTITQRGSMTEQASLQDKDASSNVGGYVGSVLGGCAVGSIITFGVFKLIQNRNKKKNNEQETSVHSRPPEIIYESLANLETNNQHSAPGFLNQ